MARTTNRNCSPISSQKAASGQTFSSCGRVTEGHSVLRFPASRLCTASTAVVQESGQEPLLLSKLLLNICRGLTRPQTQPFAWL